MVFGWWFFIFRSLASLILGLLIFFGFVGYLMGKNVRDNFLGTEFYTDSLSENDVYNRVYLEVLLDPEFLDTTEELLGDIDVPPGDIVFVTGDGAVGGLAADIITPEHLQEQVEGSVQGIIDYLNRVTDDPEAFIDLGPPLDNVKPVLFRYIDGRIDGLEDVPVATIEELQLELESLFRTLQDGMIPTKVPLVEDRDALVNSYVDERIADLQVVPAPTAEEFNQELESIFQELADGMIPDRVPSIEGIPVEDRIAAYDLALRTISNDPTFPKEAIRGLREQEQAIKAQLRTPQGDVKGALEVASRPLTSPAVERFLDDSYDKAFQTLSEDPSFPRVALEGLDRQSDAIKEHLGQARIKEALKAAARGVAGPLIDEALDELRKDLDDQDRIDLVAKAAEQKDSEGYRVDPVKSREDFLDDLDILRDGIDRAQSTWLAILVMVVAAVLMAAVHLPHLASSLRWPGLTLFLSGLVFLVVGLVMKYVLGDLFNDLVSRGAEFSPIPARMIDIISDVLTSMASDLAGGLIVPSIVLMVVGVVLLACSFFIRALHIPFLSR